MRASGGRSGRGPGRSSRPLLLLLIGLLGLRGSGRADDPPRLYQGKPVKAWISGVPDVMQSNSWSCGAAAVQAVAQYHGIWGYQDGWAEELGTSSEQGTHPLAMVEVLREYELDARLVEGMSLEDLRAHLDRGDLVILDFQAWGDPPLEDYSEEWEDGHYCVAVGYSEEHFFLEDPSLLGSVGVLEDRELLRRWHDYEQEDDVRRVYRNTAIVVSGARTVRPGFTPIE